MLNGEICQILWYYYVEYLYITDRKLSNRRKLMINRNEEKRITKKKSLVFKTVCGQTFSELTRKNMENNKLKTESGQQNEQERSDEGKIEDGKCTGYY